MHYQSVSSASDVWTDSGTATVQSDSVLVIRTFSRIVPRGASGATAGVAFPYTTSARLAGDGTALFHYSDGTVDTALVASNGAISMTLSITDAGAPQTFGTFLFATAYTGNALNPLPSVSIIQPSSAVMGSDSSVVTFTGANFMPQTAVYWNKVSPLRTTFVSHNQITVTIPGVLLKAAGKETLMLTNPAPGGGSLSYAFIVTIPEPAIMSVAPATMVAGGGSFILHVHGRGFTSATRVLWDGSTRNTTMVSDSELTTVIQSAAIATAGTYQVAVQTPPSTDGTPGGGTSGVVWFTVTGTPAQRYAEARISFGASALLADPARPLVYAVSSSYERTHPNSVLALDPATGQIVWTVALGTQGGAAAISDDGAYLYVAAGSDSVDRISLATHTLDLTIPLPGNISMFGGASGLAVLPGQPRSLALVRRCPCSDDPTTYYEVEIFDDAQLRPQTGAHLDTPPAAIGFTSAQALYVVYPGSVRSYAVTPTGLTLQGQSAASTGSGVLTIVGARVYSTSGGVYDLVSHSSTQLSIAPTNSFPTSAVTPSSDGQLLYAIAPDGAFVRAYDVATNTVAGAVDYTGSSMMPGVGSVIIRWGTDGLAFTTGFETWFIRASLVH